MTNMNALRIVVIVIVLSFASGAYSQVCKQYVNNTGYDLCTPYITYDYFLPRGPTQWTIEAILYHSAFTATSGITLVPASCEAKLLAYTCASIFPRCEKTDSGAATSRALCRSVCEDVLNSCEGYYEANPTQTPPNCTALPEHYSTYVSGTTTVELKCFEVDDDIPAPEFPFECGGPYAYDKASEEVNGFPCGIACPFPLYPYDMIVAQNWVMRFGVPIIFFAGLILSLLQVWRRKIWWSWPRVWIFVDGIVLAFTNFAQLVIVFRGGYIAIGCHSPGDSVEGDYWLATFTHWFQYYGSWGSSICFAIISTNVLLVTTRPRWLRKFTKFLNLFDAIAIFVPPTVIMIVGQAMDNNGYCSGLSSCFFNSDSPIGAITNGLLFMSTLIPFSVAQLWGYCCLLLVIFLVYRSSGFPGLVKQIRLVGYLISYGLVFSVSLIGPYESAIRGSGPTRDYIVCDTTRWINSFLHPSMESPECDVVEGRPINAFSMFYQGPGVCLLSQLLWIVFFGKETVDIFMHGERIKNKSAGTISGLNTSKSTPPPHDSSSQASRSSSAFE